MYFLRDENIQFSTFLFHYYIQNFFSIRPYHVYAELSLQFHILQLEITLGKLQYLHP